MKTTLKFTMLILAVTFPAALFAALVGILPLATFSYSAIAVYVFSVAGLMAIGLSDGGQRRPIIVHARTAPVRQPEAARPARRSRAYGIRRRECVAS